MKRRHRVVKPKPKAEGEEFPDDLLNTFHNAMGPFLAIAQFMGVMPVSGVLQRNVRRVRFRWSYIGVLVTMVLVVFGAFDLYLSMQVVMEKGLTTTTAGPPSFYLASWLGIVMFFDVARGWPALMRQYAQTERIFQDKSYETQESIRLCYRLRIRGGLMLVGVVVEHGMYMSSALYGNYQHMKKCNLTVNFWENFFTHERSQFFSIINFHLWIIPISEWVTISMTFTWSFIDIFLMLITQALALRFDQVLQRLRRLTSMDMTNEFWLRARLDFTSLLELLHAVDNRLSYLVLLSCTNNLFSICFFVFRSLQTRSNIVDIMYFWYSLAFVFTRILTMMLSAASINVTANDIMAIFYEIPLECWGPELERFYEIVSKDTIAMSGGGFFFITRRLIFAMAGTMVTYELVLLDQIDDSGEHEGHCVMRKRH